MTQNITLSNAQWQTVEEIMNELGHGQAYDEVYGLKPREGVVFTTDAMEAFGEPEDSTEIAGLTGARFQRGRKTVYVIDLGAVRLCDGDIIR